jgi:hypothetical protein
MDGLAQQDVLVDRQLLCEAGIPRLRRARGIYRKLEELAAREGNICGFRSYVHQDDVQGQRVYRGLGMAEKQFLVFEDMR